VLTQVLSLVNPAAFSRAVRIRKYVSHVVKKLALTNPWRFEVAAMMSQLGCVTLHPETVDAVYAGQSISAEEQLRFNTHPQIGGDLLADIPRMEPIAWMIADQSQAVASDGSRRPQETSESIRQGADILRAALRFDEQIHRGVGKSAALNDIRNRWKGMDPRIFQALAEVEAESSQNVVRTCSFDALSAGMIVNEEVRTPEWIADRGQRARGNFSLDGKAEEFPGEGCNPGKCFGVGSENFGEFRGGGIGLLQGQKLRAPWIRLDHRAPEQPSPRTAQAQDTIPLAECKSHLRATALAPVGQSRPSRLASPAPANIIPG
jgi:hypothetical protein